MRKFIMALSVIIILITTMSFNHLLAPKPALFPEAQQFYTSLQSTQPLPEHSMALTDLSQSIVTGMTSDKKIDLLFTCSDNSFRSLAAQIVLQSMISLNKYNKLAANSFGLNDAEVNSSFIHILSKHGYQVSEASPGANGKKTYEVKFGTNMPSLFIYAKKADDPVLPKTAFMQVKMCSSDENSCPDFTNAKFKENLPFTPVASGISEDDLDKEFSQIAAEILYAFNKAKQ